MNSTIKPNFFLELTGLINRHSRENVSGTPDFVLSRYLEGCLLSFELAVHQREEWFGRDTSSVMQALKKDKQIQSERARLDKYTLSNDEYSKCVALAQSFLWGGQTTLEGEEYRRVALELGREIAVAVENYCRTHEYWPTHAPAVRFVP